MKIRIRWVGKNGVLMTRLVERSNHGAPYELGYVGHEFTGEELRTLLRIQGSEVVRG